MLVADESGMWVLSKRLDRGTFSWPAVGADIVRFEYRAEQLALLLAALDVARGNVIGKTCRRHRAAEFVRLLDEIESRVPLDVDVHPVMDNYATHKTDSVKRWLLHHPRYKLHFTPTSSSWLNLVESFFSMVERNVTRRGVHRSVGSLESSVREFLDAHNSDPKPFVWTKSADAILDNLRRYCEDATATREQRLLRQMSRTSKSTH